MLSKTSVELRLGDNVSLKVGAVALDVRASIILRNRLCGEGEIAGQVETSGTGNASECRPRCRRALQDEAKSLNRDVFRRWRKPCRKVRE
ncbi:hypothetical protein LZK73_15245 [Neorhizobium galegae]|nr:hypothetical protein LZK73_15245 [Neorhizobium galegae]